MNKKCGLTIINGLDIKMMVKSIAAIEIIFKSWGPFWTYSTANSIL